MLKKLRKGRIEKQFKATFKTGFISAHLPTQLADTPIFFRL
ncbi:hypothetical protein VCHE48_2690 [Vibrio cholerae HE48]|nr:hypothetical protein VCHE48_2690 [Vibrio cholerae HE48]